MMTITFSAKDAIRQLNLITRKERDRVRQAVRTARRALAIEIKAQGDRQILSAGNFSRRWTDSFQVTERGERTDSHLIDIGFDNRIPFGLIHETGGEIRGKPTLWIPLPWTNLKGTSARNFVGGLFKVNRPGKNPLLFSIRDKQPKYVGVPFVSLQPRFHIRAMVERLVPARFAAAFERIWVRERGR